MLVLASCIQEDLTPALTSDGDNILLNFGIVVPEAQTATKSISAPAITSLTVVAFDEYGYFVAAADAAPVNGWGVSSTTATQFKVSLPQSASARKLHFIANGPAASTFSYGAETDIMTGLVSEGGNDAYWQTLQVSSLLVQDQNSLNASMQNIPMIRNYAKVRIGTVVGSFNLTGYALINVPTSGTMVPYNTDSGSFQDYENGGVGLEYAALKTAGYTGFMPENVAFAVNVDDQLADINWITNTAAVNGVYPGAYTYESSADCETSLLVRGKYSGSQTDTYYKVAIFDADCGTHDILRNIEYVVNITNVAGAGYSTALEAARSDAGNNISVSTKTKNLLNISDGTQRLYVEYTAKRVVSTEPFTLKYKFMPTSSTVLNKLHPQAGFNYGNPTLPSDGEPITITRRTTSEDGTSVVTALTVENQGQNTDAQGFSTITITPQSSLPNGSNVWSEEITIKSTYNNVVLSRTVTLYMLNPYVMSATCNQRVANQVGQDVDVNINLPVNLPDEIFPLVFDIEAAKMSIYPNTTSKAVNILGEVISMPVVSGKSIIPAKANGSSTFHFQRTLTKEEYDALKSAAGESAQTVAVPCYFRTNIGESATTIYVYNEYFNLADCSFVAYGAKYFTNLAFPNGVKAVVESPTTFTFSMPTTDPVTVTLTGLEPADNTQLVATRADGTYTYTPTASGTQTLNLKTLNASGTVKVELAADAADYAPAYLDAVQANNIKIATSATLSFTRKNNTTPDIIESISVEGGTVAYGSFNIGGSGNNRTITFTDLVFTGNNLSDNSAVIIILNNQNWMNYDESRCRVTINTTIGALKGN